MVKTASTMLSLGTPLPEFSLPNVVSGSTVSSADFGGKPLLVMFICNHCPFVKHLRDPLADFGKEYVAKGLSIVAISSNDVENYPDDSPEKMVEEAADAGYTFPYLYDADQSVAKTFTAACTPDFFLFDGFGKLAYRGQFDSSRPGDGTPITGEDLRRAATLVVDKAPVPEDQTPSLGCNIKWIAGQEPEYFTGVSAV